MGYVFKLEIQANSPAFGSSDQQRLAEIARCLRVASDQCENGRQINHISDRNGKTVGTYVFATTAS